MGSRFSPLQTANFRYFFIGEVINRVGSSMSGVALAFAVLDISDSASALGVVVAASGIPTVVFMLLGGAIADRLPRALVLRGCNLIQGFLQTTVAILVLTRAAQIWHLVVLEGLAGVLFAVTYPAFLGMVPILLPPEERKAAYVLISQATSAVSIAGPAISGLIVATVGPGVALAVDASTYLVAAGLLALVKLPPGDRTGARPSVLGDFKDGWAFARELGWVIPAASCALVFNALVSAGVGVLGPVIAKDTIGSEGWGVATACQALGAFGVGFVLTHVTIKVPLRTIMITFALWCLPTLVLGTYVDLWLLCGAFLVAGAALGVLDLSWNLVVQEKVPEHMLSRIMAIDGFFSFVATPLGQLAVGPIAVAFGIGEVEIGCFVLALAVAAFAATRPRLNAVRLGEPQASLR